MQIVFAYNCNVFDGDYDSCTGQYRCSWQPEKKEVIPIPPSICPKTTCEITKYCCGYKGNEKNQLNNPAVSAVPIPASCPCPEDTNPEPAGYDATAPGGPYNICKCK